MEQSENASEEQERWSIFIGLMRFAADGGFVTGVAGLWPEEAIETLAMAMDGEPAPSFLWRTEDERTGLEGFFRQYESAIRGSSLEFEFHVLRQSESGKLLTVAAENIILQMMENGMPEFPFSR